MQWQSSRIRAREQAPMHLQRIEHGARVAQKTTSSSNCNQAPNLLASGIAPRHGHAHPTNDARSDDGAAPPAVAHSLGDIQDKTNNIQPCNAVIVPKPGADATKGCVGGMGATPPGSGLPARKIEMAAALGAQPGMPRYAEEPRVLRAPQSTGETHSTIPEPTSTIGRAIVAAPEVVGKTAVRRVASMTVV